MLIHIVIRSSSKELLLKTVLFLPEYDELLEFISILLRIAEELVLKELSGICSLLGVLVEAVAHEVLENWRPLRVLELRRVLCHYQIQYFLLRLTDVRGLTVGEFKGENTEGPDVYLDVVRCFTANQFRGHPADSTNFTVSLSFFLSELGGIAEIGQFQITGLVNQDIIRLDVSVDDISFM